VSWLGDPALYAHVRALFRNGRVVSRNGDLTGTRTLRAIADVATKLHTPVRVVYFSNAEQLFKYDKTFRESMELLPTEAQRGRAHQCTTGDCRTRSRTTTPNGTTWCRTSSPSKVHECRLSLELSLCARCGGASRGDGVGRCAQRADVERADHEQRAGASRPRFDPHRPVRLCSLFACNRGSAVSIEPKLIPISGRDPFMIECSK
jgi:hypothetical protein